MSRDWDQVASLTGGTVSDLVVTATGITLAATAAGLFRTVDRGTSWTATNSRDGPSMIEAVTPSPSFADDSTIFVGSHLGLHRSLDVGVTWQPLLTNGQVHAVRVSPSYARDHFLIAGTEADGILRSEDGGQTWAGANAGLLDLSITAISISPGFEQDQTCFAGTLSGLYWSRNAGKSWQAIDAIPDETAVQCIAQSPRFATDHLVLTGTELDGLWRSPDGGRRWEEMAALTGRSVLAITFSRQFPTVNTIAVATDSGLFVSLDGGESWHQRGRELGAVLSIIFVPSDHGEVLMAGRAGEGIAISDDMGESWRTANQGLHARLLVGLTPSPRFPHDQTLVASDLQFGVLRSTDAGSTWTVRNDGLDDTSVTSIRAIAHGADYLSWYTATGSGVFRSRQDVAAWQRISSANHVPTTGAIAVGPPTNGGSTKVIAALRGGRLLERDDDNEWRSLGRPFQREEVVSLGLSPGYVQDRTMWAVTNAVGSAVPELDLWHSATGGEVWDRWIGTSGQPVMPLAIAPDYLTTGTIFVGIGNQVLHSVRNGHKLARGSPGPMFRGVDLGSASSLVTALALSPDYRTDGTLFAATSSGVFVSRDRGRTFRQWTEGSGPSSVVALALTPSDGKGSWVYAVELGGVIWRRCEG